MTTKEYKDFGNKSPEMNPESVKKMIRIREMMQKKRRFDGGMGYTKDLCGDCGNVKLKGSKIEDICCEIGGIVSFKGPVESSSF